MPIYQCLLSAYPHRMTGRPRRQLSKSYDLRFRGGRFPLIALELI
jgi:hypothetical protein